VSPDIDSLVARPLLNTTLASSDASQIVLAEWADDGSRGPEPIAPPHVHRQEDEAWYVLEGRLGFRLGHEEIEAGPGDAVVGPRGTPHSYWNAGPGRARYLIVMGPLTNAALEKLHDGTPRDAAQIRQLFREHAIDVVSSSDG
jgi:mannose-6-phosphate isomerase-like protein (cupin superfamily)